MTVRYRMVNYKEAARGIMVVFIIAYLNRLVEFRLVEGAIRHLIS